MTTRDKYFALLRAWADALIEYQLDDPRHATLDGAILCPACSVIHGRCYDAVYPLMCMAELTGDEKYLSAAKKLFDWAEYMVCDDLSLYNDSQSAWNGVTVFAAIGLAHALNRHSRLLSAREIKRWEARLSGMGEWLYASFTEATPLNINYVASNACALMLLGEYFNNGDYADRARELAAFAIKRITEGGILYGEGKPLDTVTPRGCRAVDVGYNVEESLPSLYEYARASGDTEAEKIIVRAMRAHLRLMLPDGAWDNSFGTRNFKWTYWGGRTSDGCQAAFNALGKRDPVFAEAALRNLELYERCTSNGLLYGGPHYLTHGEQPCVHHTFCHAKVLAEALDEGVCEFERARIPSDDAPALERMPETDTYFARAGDWRMTVTGNDFEYMRGGHASGGAMTLLWHALRGAVAASANTDFSLTEAHNQQLTRKKAAHRPLCPRAEITLNGKLYAQYYDTAAEICASAEGESVLVSVRCALSDIDHERAPLSQCELKYALALRGLVIEGRLPEGAVFIMPVVSHKNDVAREQPGEISLISPDARLVARCEGLAPRPERIFNLAPGFEALELRVAPDARGRFELTIAVIGEE